MYAYILTSVIAYPAGFPANFTAFFLSFDIGHLMNNYKYFFANFSICELMYCTSLAIQTLFHLYHRLWGVPMSAIRCLTECNHVNGHGLGFHIAIALISINSYCLIVLNCRDRFTRRRCFLLCLRAYVPCACPILALLFA